MSDTAEVPVGTSTVWTDVRDMEWGTFPGLGSGLVKVLHVDEEGTPIVMLVHLPPGKLDVKIPHRHHHLTVYEHAYHTAGDFPHGEWASADSDDHDLVIFRDGYFLDRKPGSLHGLDHMFSQTGAVILCWRSGTGNWIDEPNAAEETIDIEIGDGFRSKGPDEVVRARQSDAVVFEREDGTRVTDTRDMPWEPLGEGKARVRVLTRDAAGEPTVRMVFLPPGDAPVEDLPLGDGDREFAYVVEGELPVAGAEGDEMAREGYFMNRAPGSADGINPAAPSKTGAVLLQWRIGPDTFKYPEGVGA